MNRKMVVAALAVWMLWPVASETQEPRARPRARPRVRVESGPYGVFSFSDNRGRIGVIVDMRADAAGDKNGARVDGLPPGGPAEKAGLKAGDVITSLNDKPIRSSSDLRVRLSLMTVGTSVDLGVNREGKKMTVKVAIGKTPATQSAAAGGAIER